MSAWPRDTTPADRIFSGVGAAAAFLGLLVYAVSAVAHPGIPPHETERAFAHYAAEPNWALIHIGELLGILLMTVAALALASRLRGGMARGSGRPGGAARVWATLGGAAMLVFAAVYTIFIAVDGVALGVLVDRWAAAPVEQRALLFEAAFAVRQIEGGLFSIQWFMFGLATGMFALAFFAASDLALRSSWQKGMGWLSVLASLGALAFGTVQAITGYSATAMAFQTGLYPGVLWTAAVGLWLWRAPPGGATGR